VKCFSCFLFKTVLITLIYFSHPTFPMWGPKGQYVVSGVHTLLVCVCTIQKPEKCDLFLPSPRHACPCHDPWKRLWTAKPCKGETRVPDAIIGTNQLKELTPTENPRSSKVAGVEHKASKLVS